MKTCPYCAEEIQDAAIKCRFCGSMLIGDPTPMVRPASSVVKTRSSGTPWKAAGFLMIVIGMFAVFAAPPLGAGLMVGGFIVFIIGRFHDG